MLVLSDRGNFYCLPNIKPRRVIFIINALSAYQLTQHWRFVTSRTTDNVGRCYPGNVCECANHYHCDVNITDGRDTYLLFITNYLSAEVIRASYKLLSHYRCSLYCLMFIVAEICGAYFVFRINIYTVLPCYLQAKTANTENLLLNCSKHLTCALTDWLTNQLTARASNYSMPCLPRTEFSYKPDQGTSYFYGKRRFINVLLRAWHWSLFEPV